MDETGKTYEFRPLRSTDLFLMCKIIGKIGINEFTACFSKDSIKQMISEASGEVKLTSIVGVSVALEIASVIIAKLPECEKDIYQLLSNTSNLDVEQIKEMGMVEFFEMLVEFIEKDEFKDFIEVASKLLITEK